MSLYAFIGLILLQNQHKQKVHQSGYVARWQLKKYEHMMLSELLADVDVDDVDIYT